MVDQPGPIRELLEVMERLRDPERGCPWDRVQSAETIAPYTIEEAYEVADAVERGDPTDLRDELGDLLFQVVFQSRLAEERGWFDFNAVVTAIRNKLIRRHPHVFGGAGAESAAEHSFSWEEHKARERAEAMQRRGVGEPSVLGDVPKALPALARAAKLGRRAARVGFDWPEASGVRAKLNEELAELDEAASKGAASQTGNASAEIEEELGDALFTLVNLGRHLHVDAEEALRAANNKFESRFRHMEKLAHGRGFKLEALSAKQWDALWLESKLAAAKALRGKP